MADRVRQFRLPDLGEGLTEGEILQWLVKVGDVVRLNQPLVEVETAKAAVEVPSPYAGVVLVLHHAAGDIVDVGSPIISVDTEPGAGPLDPAPPAMPAVPPPATAPASLLAIAPTAVPASAPPASPAGEAPAQAGLIGTEGAGGRTAVLVGYGPKSAAAKRRPRAPATDASSPAAGSAVPPAPARVSAAAVGLAAASRAGAPVRAKPPVRILARQLGVDLSSVVGTGPDGTLTRADVQAAAPAAAPVRDSPAAAGSAAAGSVGESGWGGSNEAVTAPSYPPVYDPATRERRIPVRGVRKATAEAMVTSAFTAPHVTEFLTLDVTATMEWRRRLAAEPELDGIRVTPLLLVARALLLAVRRHPEVNATWAGEEIVLKDYVHLGIATATPRGLLVPVVHDADAMTMAQLGAALRDLTETARAGRTSPTQLAGGTITITNVGSFGVDNGTPILPPGQSVILCLGAIRPMPWVVDGEVVARQVTQLSLSFDHRNIDGQLGSEFLRDIGRVLTDPMIALLW